MASLVAGPIFSAPILFIGLMMQAGSLLAAFGMIATALFGTMIVGFFIALLPNLLGAVMLASLGKRHCWARRVPVWAAAGFGLGGVISVGAEMALEMPVGRADWPLALTGAACALICRWNTRWAD